VSVAVTNQQLAEWRATGYTYKIIAALITEWARPQERGTQVPDDDYFSGQLDIITSASTFKRARAFLAAPAQGVLFTSDGPYMVA
jgi:hypothetical protein